MFNRIILSFFLLAGITLDAAATSCTPHTQSYFIRCDASGCHEAFSVTEVPAFLGCSRRPIVENVDKQVGEFISKMVTEIHTPEARGLYQLSLSTRYWEAHSSNKLERLMEQLESTLPFEANGERCKVRALSTTELAAKLKRADLRDLLVHVTKDATVQGTDARRTEFEDAEFIKKIQSILIGMAYWGGALIALIILVQSVHLYFQRIYRPDPGQGRAALLAPVGIQLGVGFIGVVAALAMFDFWPGSLLVPAVAIILLCEGWICFRVSRKPM